MVAGKVSLVVVGVMPILAAAAKAGLVVARVEDRAKEQAANDPVLEAKRKTRPLQIE